MHEVGQPWRDEGMYDVPDALKHGPLTRRCALEGGVPARVLEGVQFRRIHHGVYRHRGHVMTFADEVRAARLALPPGARTTGITRLQELGLGHGPRRPLHFVVEGDHHLALDGVFLHRTVSMPPCDDEQGVSVEAAYVAHCAETWVLDAIKVGSWLLHEGLMEAGKLEALLDEQPWRRGAAGARWVFPYLDGRCRSLPETALVTFLRFAGLPEPEVNAVVELAPGIALTPDVWFDPYRGAVEYEGSQHQEDRGQYNADIDRYALYRRHRAGYIQVTKERMRSPKATVRAVHALLVEGGYGGPPPHFGELWSTLSRALRDVVRSVPGQGIRG